LQPDANEFVRIWSLRPNFIRVALFDSPALKTDLALSQLRNDSTLERFQKYGGRIQASAGGWR
jgi:hypothetical protein